MEMIDLNDAPVELDRPTIPEDIYTAKSKFIPGDEEGELTRSHGASNYVKLHWVLTKGEFKGAINYDQISVEVSGRHADPARRTITNSQCRWVTLAPER